MNRSLLASLLVILPAAALQAQHELPRFRIELGLGAGDLEHTTESSPLDGATDAGMFRLHFEAFATNGFGGGVRYEVFASDDDLFVPAGFNATEASTGSLFAHVSYRVEAAQFAMPLRAGLLFAQHTLDDKVADQETDFTSLGVQFEAAPEFFLTRDADFSWSLHAGLGFGIGATVVESDGLPGDFESDTGFLGLEIGTRVRFSAVELGLSYVLRSHSMDESDPEGGLAIFGYDSQFDGVMLSVAAVF